MPVVTLQTNGSLIRFGRGRSLEEDFLFTILQEGSKPFKLVLVPGRLGQVGELLWVSAHIVEFLGLVVVSRVVPSGDADGDAPTHEGQGPVLDGCGRVVEDGSQAFALDILGDGQACEVGKGGEDIHELDN